ncbi:Crp/Fnr family transcriptional regulator [Pediococcus acidilactici]|uniref:Crp/Fnr family transcriptional regulator n=1 Tax=Pediococcus acidilactici TaxID=1254 RepID=UPI000FFE2612|nr:Crp/Fnr family transcriptional regulator [Pediococcus acidilactici]QAT21031.1 Crp/Fnr family transcriptional regulator [Pediococcus acidilactici]
MEQRDFVKSILQHPLIRNHCRIEEYKRNIIVKTPGILITEIGIVLKGYLKAIIYSRCGKEMCETIFGPNSIVLEYLHFSGDKRSTYNLGSINQCQICWIPIENFSKVVLEDPEFSKMYIRQLAKRGLENQRLITCLGYKTVRERIAYWIISSGNSAMESTEATELEFPVSQEVFSEILHVTRSSLNQELQKMSADGLFAVKRNVLKNIDYAKLVNEI